MCGDDRRTRVRAKEETTVPSEQMRVKAREWWTNPEYPDECPTEHEVDTLATLLDGVRDTTLEEVAKGCDAYGIAYPGDERYERACRSCAIMIRGRMSGANK
jgi:hypothetical protein